MRIMNSLVHVPATSPPPISLRFQDTFRQIFGATTEACLKNQTKLMQAWYELLQRWIYYCIYFRDIQVGVRLTLPGELMKHAVSEGDFVFLLSLLSVLNVEGAKAVSNYKFGVNEKTPPITTHPAQPSGPLRSTRAGLQFPVGTSVFPSHPFFSRNSDENHRSYPSIDERVLEVQNQHQSGCLLGCGVGIRHCGSP